MEQFIEFVSNNPMLSLAWVGLAGALVYSIVKGKLSKVTLVDHQRATMLMNKEDAVVVDVRSDEEFRKGRIVGAKQLPESQIQAQNFSAVEKYKDTPIIVVCETGMRSSGAADKLSKAGFTKVYNLRGGMAAWREANLPVSKKK